MSEAELKNDVEGGQTHDEGATLEGEFTEIEQKAIADGWKPDGIEGKEFVSAEKFLENGSFFRKIDSQKKQIEQLETSFNQLKVHHDRVAENEHKKAEKEYKAEIDRLKSEKVAALDEGDNRRVVELDDQILNTEKPVDEPKEDVVFTQWTKNNEWYGEDQFLAVQADMVAQQYLNKGLRGKELLDTMTEHMKTAYPDRFKKDSDRPASVEGGTARPRTQSKNLSEKDLTPDERAVFKNFNRMNMFKDDAAKTKYFKEVVELRD